MEVNPDFVFVLATMLDNQSLEVLSHVPVVWDYISKSANGQYFWYIRSQNLVGRELKIRNDTDWKRIYYLLVTRQEWMSEHWSPGMSDIFGIEGLLEYTPAVEVFLELGHDPSMGASQSVRIAAKRGYIDTLKLLLKDDRVDPTAENNYALKKSAEQDQAESIKLLIQDRRVDPSYSDGSLLYSLVIHNEDGKYSEILRTLLLDKRVRAKLDITRLFDVARLHGKGESEKIILDAMMG